MPSVREGNALVGRAAQAADLVAVLVLLAAAVVVRDFVSVHALVRLRDVFLEVRGVCYPVAAEGNR